MGLFLFIIFLPEIWAGSSPELVEACGDTKTFSSSRLFKKQMNKNTSPLPRHLRKAQLSVTVEIKHPELHRKKNKWIRKMQKKYYKNIYQTYFQVIKQLLLIVLCLYSMLPIKCWHKRMKFHVHASLFLSKLKFSDESVISNDFSIFKTNLKSRFQIS